jgi:hypothetical protein
MQIIELAAGWLAARVLLYFSLFGNQDHGCPWLSFFLSLPSSNQLPVLSLIYVVTSIEGPTISMHLLLHYFISFCIEERERESQHWFLHPSSPIDRNLF